VIQFDAAPPVPSRYPRLNALTPTEIKQARVAGYVADEVDPSSSVRRAGIDNYAEPRADDDLRDWRTRMYVVWFCYVYENLSLIGQPLYALEELVLEFKAQDVLDLPGRRLATLYAGAGGHEPISSVDRSKQLHLLRPHYAKAAALLDSWSALQP
jgi:hypothetical protein